MTRPSPAAQTYTFIAAASGTPTPTVRWQISTDGGGTFADVPGATAGTLTGTAVARATPASCSGPCSPTPRARSPRAAANLTVTGVAPQVTEQPTAMTVEVGQSYAFTVAASGIPTPTVQWQASVDHGATFQHVGGSVSPTLSGTAAASQNGTQYRAVFTNSEGAVTTDAATLTVVPAFALAVGNAAVVEGDSGGTRPVAVAVTLSRPAPASVTVRYATANGTASAATDYTAKSGTPDVQGGDHRQVRDRAGEGGHRRRGERDAVGGAHRADG